MSAGGLRAGAGKASLAIPASVYPIDGFDGEHDPLHARVLLLESGAMRVALAVVDQTSVADQSLTRLKTVISKAGEVPPDNILICASHTFSAPHIRPPDRAAADELAKMTVLQNGLEDTVKRATERARLAMEPARIGFGHGRCDVNVNRDVLSADGWWLGTNETGESDKSVTVLRVETSAGKTVALVFNYAVQSSVMNESVGEDGRKQVTSDLAGSASRHIETEYEGAVALFIIGAAADQAPALVANSHRLDRHRNHSRQDIGEQGFVLVDLLGERLGAEVVRISEQVQTTESQGLSVTSGSVPVPTKVPPVDMRRLRPTTTHEFVPVGTEPAPFWILRVGDVALAGVRVELTSATGAEIKRRAAAPATLIGTLVNGADKYMADAASYDRLTYESLNSRYARGAAETLTDAISNILGRQSS